MSLRIARLAFGPLSAGAVGFGDSVDDGPTAIPAPEIPLLNLLKQKLLTDEVLAANLQSGDTDALTVLFERHAPRLLGVARRILRNDAEAEDAVQQTFLDAFRSIQQFDPDKGAFKTWLFMFGYQRTFNCRRSQTANRFFDTEPFDEILTRYPSQPESQLNCSMAEATVLIEQVLRSLQPRQRRTIELVYCEGLTAEEISVRTGESVRVVRHNLYRGLEKLRKAVHETPSSSADGPQGGGR